MSDVKKALVPKLRFPEFRSEKEWSREELGNICRIQTGKKDANEGLKNGLYPFFTCAEDHIYSDVYSFDTEAILVAGNANVGQTKYYRGRFEAYQRTYVLSGFKSISVHYLYALLTADLRQALLREVQSSAMSYIKLSMLREYALSIPPTYDEQQKIADCLSSLDELIVAHGDKLDALKIHKKGLLQQLFPREDETAPCLRFPDFRGAKVWQVISLDNVADVVASGDLDSELYSVIQTEKHHYPVYSNSVYNEGLYGYYLSPKYPEGSVTITARGTLGVAFVRNHAFMAIGRLIVVSGFENLIPGFFEELWNHLVATPQEVTSIPQLTAVAARATRLPAPDVIEQQKIVNCLSSLDDRIAAQADKIESLKQHKKGLLQQLFPAMDDIGP